MRTLCGTILAAAMVAGVIGSVNAAFGALLDAKGVVVNGDVICEVERRMFLDGEAVRYRLPDGVATVSCERTEWRLPVDAQIWYQPQSSCYEASFKSCRVGEASIGEKMNLPLRPCGGYCARISPAKGRRICRSARSIATRRSTTSSTWVDRYHYTAAGYELLVSQVVKRVSAARVCSASGLEGENENK